MCVLRAVPPAVLTPQILKVAEIEKTADIRRPYIKQLVQPKLRFPLPHRRPTARGIYAARRPATFY